MFKCHLVTKTARGSLEAEVTEITMRTEMRKEKAEPGCEEKHKEQAMQELGKKTCGLLEAQVKAEIGEKGGEKTGKQMLQSLFEAMQLKVVGGVTACKQTGRNTKIQ